MRIFTVIIAFLALSAIPTSSMAYGYGAKDPLVLGFKEISKHLRKNDWNKIQTELDKLKAQSENAQSLFGRDLKKEFDEAVSNKDANELGNTWILLTAQTCRLHLWWNLHEDLQDRKRCKARMDAINRLLKDVIGAPIKRKDKDLYKKVAKNISNLRDHLGSDGAFGVGKVEKNPDKFFEELLKFESNLIQAFPALKPSWVKDISKDKAADQAKGFLKKSKEANDFTTRHSNLIKAMTALKFTSSNDWKKPFRKLYPLMGTPTDGKKKGKEVSSTFASTVDNVIKTIK